MAKLYTLKISEGITIGDVFFVSYNPPKLVLRLSAAHANQISKLGEHVPARTVMNCQLEHRSEAIRHSTVALSGLKQTMSYGKDEFWQSQKFRAQVTSANYPPLQFELTLLDNVDLAGLNDN